MLPHWLARNVRIAVVHCALNLGLPPAACTKFWRCGAFNAIGVYQCA